MRKKVLLKEMESIIERNNELFKKCNELTKAVEMKSAEIERLKAELSDLTADNQRLNDALQFKFAELIDKKDIYSDKPSNEDKSENVSLVAEEEIIAESVEEELTDFEEKTEASVVADSLENEPIVNITPLIKEDVLKIASKSIGKVVLECAELCNDFATQNKINSKDLINLALGRTEVFKADVLALATEDMSEERLTAELNSRIASVREYFQMLERQ